MSFVLAMVLSVGLGLTAFAGNDSTSSRSNSGVMRQAGTQVTATSSLVDRITTVFHYEHGMITCATGADGTISLYDRGQYRMSLTLGLNGEYSVSNIQVYGTDYAEIQAAGGLDNWLMKWGVTEEQLQGGGSPEQWVETTKEEYNDHKDDKDANGNPVYKTETDSETGEIKYKKYQAAEPGEHVKWTGMAMNHLAGGINKSISINFNATDGASLTLNLNGKAYQTYAWDGELISENEYFVAPDGENGVITWQAENDLVQEKDGDGTAVSTLKIDNYEDVKDSYVKAWSKTTTKGGKVVSCVNDANPTQELRRYDYNADGSINRILDYANGTVTFITTTGQVTLSALDGTNLYTTSNAVLDEMFSEIFTYSKEKDEATGDYIYTFNDKVVTEDEYGDLLRSKGFRVSSVIAYNKNGTYNYSVNIDDSGKVSTTAYIANKQVATGNGWVSPSSLRKQANDAYDFVLNGGAQNLVADTTVTIHWYADQLREIANGGQDNNPKLDRFITSMGWDVNGDAGRTDNNGKDISNRGEALAMITDALNFSSGNGSPAITLTYSNTAYDQSQLDELAEEAGVDVSDIPATRYVSAATVYHHNAQSYQLNFADKDPSLARASYITAASIFTDEIMAQYGLNEYTTITEFDNAMEAIAQDIENELNAYVDSNGKDNGKFNYSNYDTIVSQIAAKYFKDPDKMKMNIKWNVENKDGGKEWNGVTEYIGQATHNVDVGTRTDISEDTSNVNSSALKELLTKVAGYVRQLGGIVRTGGEAGVGQLKEYMGRQLETTVECQRTITTTTLYKKVDPVVVGKPTVTDDGKLRYGPGSTVYLEDGTSHVLQEGEEIFVDVSELPDGDKVLEAAREGKEIMTMGNVKPTDDGSFEMVADENYGHGYMIANSKTDRSNLAAIEAELLKGEDSSIDWISDNAKQNKGILENGYENWQAGWNKLLEEAVRANF